MATGSSSHLAARPPRPGRSPARHHTFHAPHHRAFSALCIPTIRWLDRNGVRDQIDGEITFSHVVYFSMISVTTVGYGDIVPVTTRTRLIDALVVPPVRLTVRLLILGTAHQLIIRQYMENDRMAKLQATLNSHIIVYGFRHNRMSAAKGLLAREAYARQIVVINEQEECVWSAGTLDISAF